MNKKTFIAFISPSLFIMVILMVIPLFAAMYLGLNVITYSNLNEPVFVGFQNYREVLTDPDFWKSLQFTLIYILATVPVQIFLGFIVAICLDQVRRLRGLYIGILLLPMIITPVVATLLFRSLFDKGGIIYYVLREFFNYNFVFKTSTVKFLIFINAVWSAVSFTMIVLFSGLQTLNKSTLEAATVDGATFFQKIRYVVLPHLSSLFVFLGLMNVMDSYKAFDNILVLSKQNPLFRVDTIMYYNFKMATIFGRLGKANAMSILTVIGIFVVLIPYLIITYKQQTESK